MGTLDYTQVVKLVMENVYPLSFLISPVPILFIWFLGIELSSHACKVGPSLTEPSVVLLIREDSANKEVNNSKS